MAVDHVLINKSPGEIRVALMSQGRLIELVVARKGRESIAGNIYLSRVQAVKKGIEAAFVDIGEERAGFLALPEARPVDRTGEAGESKDTIGDYLGEGDAVLVQVMRDPAEDKGAKLTTHINLAGVNLVFRPGQPGVTISRRIEDETQRRRLTGTIEALGVEEGGFIVRTAAVDAGDGDIQREARGLMDGWAEIRHQRANAKAPTLMRAEPGPAVRALRDLGFRGIEKVIADDADALSEVRGFCEAEMPALLPCLEAHKGKKGLFDAFGAEEQIDRALSPVVGLTGGGSLIISQTPALTAIDVNSGGAGTGGSKEQTALMVDKEAAAEIAREIRLRNISGLIVVDFVPVRESAHKRAVLDALIAAVAADPQGPHVVGYTRMGLVEMMRRKQGLSLGEIFAGGGGAWTGLAATGPQKSPLTQALEALRGALRDGQGVAAKGLVLKVTPAAADAFKGPAAAALKEAEEKLGLAIKPVADQTFADGRYDVVCE